MSCLTTLANIKVLNGLSADDTSQDAIYRLLIERCSARIEVFCRRAFLAANYTEYYAGNGDKLLPLQQRPINSVASVYVDEGGYWGQASGAFAAGTLLTAGTEYAIKLDAVGGATGASGMLYRIDGVWPKYDAYRPGTISSIPVLAPGNIKVTYNAGYTTIPADVAMACEFLVANTKRSIKTGAPISSEGWEGYSYQVDSAAAECFAGLPRDTLAILSNYRNAAVG
jgi:hypothetical protein